MGNENVCSPAQLSIMARGRTKRMLKTGPHNFVMEKWIDCAPFEQLLGMEIIDAAGGQSHLRMPFYKEFSQGAGLMHGGALVSLADTAVVMAIKSIVEPESQFVTISCESRFLYPVKGGAVRAEGEVVSVDERLIFGCATLFNDMGREVMEFTSTFKLARDARLNTVAFKGAASK